VVRVWSEESEKAGENGQQDVMETARDAAAGTQRRQSHGVSSSPENK